jgi:dienelactone hydrolase
VTLVAALLAAAGVTLLATAGGDAYRRHVVVDGVPLDEVHPAGLAPGERRPGVVVAHGYAGSATLMAPFGDTLASQGYVVVLLDFAGHGRNPRPRTDTAALRSDLDVALAHLRGLRDVDESRVALVGHSMGATAVTDYAATDPGVTATVALSLPEVPPSPVSRLLLLVGQAEFPGFHDTAAGAAARSAGSKVVTVPGVEHITILYAARAHHETVAWLDSALGGPRTDHPMPSPLHRAAGAGLLFLALLLGMYPLARVVLGRARPAPRPAFDPLQLILVAGAALVAGLVAAVLPTSGFPLSSGGYAVAFTLTFGALLTAYRLARPAGTSARPRSRTAFLLVGYALVTVVVPLQLGFTNVVPVGSRWWLLPVVWAGFALLSYGAERVFHGDLRGVLAVSAVTVVALTAAATLGLTNGFLLLVVPLLAVLLVLAAAWSVILNRLSAPTWVIALAGSLLVAWPIAMTLPVAG